MIIPSIRAGRPVFQRPGIDGLAILEFVRRKGPLQVAATTPAPVTTCRDRNQKRRSCLISLRIVALARSVAVDEVRRAHQAIPTDVRLVGEMMKHQYAPTPRRPPQFG